MDYDTSLKDLIISRSTELLQPDRKGKGFICPICRSGSGPDGTGITTEDNVHYTCWARHCFTWADIIDIEGLIYGLTDYPAKLKKCADLLGIRTEDYDARIPHEVPTQKKQGAALQKKELKDYTAYLSSCAANVEQAADYLTSRGISLDMAKRFKLGYDSSCPVSDGTTADGKPVYAKWKALIIPTGNGKNNYTIRNTANNGDRYKNRGAAALFNQRALYESDQPVFVTEGELDAISIYEAGGEAMALGSTSNVDMLVKLLQNNRPKATLLLSLDEDKQGREAQNKLEEQLKCLQIKYYTVPQFGKAKDANEALVKDRKAFIAAVEDAKLIEEREQLAEKEEYLRQNRVDNALQSFIDKIMSGDMPKPIPTGFKQLDTILDGGLYPSLIVLGAITSLGKTALAMQLADQIAQAGHDVLIFSMEMSREELMARSISRETILEVTQNGGRTEDAKTGRGISAGDRYSKYSQTEMALIQKAFTRYEAYADHLYIVEGMGDIGVKQIRERIERHISFTGETPVVLVDYLQILAPADVKATDKQNTDKAVLELKRMSRDFNTPVICVSSVNRASYKEAISFESLKESGAIEFGSDVVLGLQLEGAGTAGFDTEKAKEENLRSIEMKILKNRAGKSGKKVFFDYYPMFNLYEEREGDKC